MDPQVAQRIRQIQTDAYLRLLRVVAAQPLTWVRSFDHVRIVYIGDFA
jgi:hypothetical protein